MVLLISGASHTGKTVLAQRLMVRYGWPYFSIDHLKMGLIRSGNVALSPLEDEALREVLWPIVREMVRTVIENGQHLIVEGDYIPYDWRKDFSEAELVHVRHRCLVMSERYLREHFAEVRRHAEAIERRHGDADCTLEALLEDNARHLALCQRHGGDLVLIEESPYWVEIDL